jgi:hypothetical protein
MSSISLLNNVSPNRHWTGHADGRYQERTAAIYHVRYWPLTCRRRTAAFRHPGYVLRDNGCIAAAARLFLDATQA